MNPVPFGRGIAAIDWFGPVELGVALRDEVGMEVGDGAVRVSVDRVVRRVGVQLHRLAERLVVLRFGARVGLRQRFQRLLHQPDAHPLAVRLAHDRAVMCPVDGEVFLRHSGGSFVGHGNLRRGYRPLLGAVPISEAVALLRHGLEILVDVVDAARCVHPAGAVVESLVDEELAPGQRAVHVQAFLADHLRFGPEEKRGMRIDQQQRVLGRRVGRRDSDTVRPGRFRSSVRASAKVSAGRRRAGGQVLGPFP